MNAFSLFCVLCLVLLVGCGLAQRIPQAAQEPSPMLGGKTPIEVTLKGAESLVQGNWIEGGIQIALAVAATIAGALSLSAKSQASKTARKVNGASIAAGLAPALSAAATSMARKGVK